MGKINSNNIRKDSSFFNPNPLNTSCTGGTISDLSLTSPNENSENVSYILTYKELRSFPGLETVSQDEAENIIKSLYQLSMISYQVLING